MTQKPTLHIQQNTTLDRVAVIVDSLRNQDTDLEHLAALCHVKCSVLRSVILPFLRSLSIISVKNPLSLTTCGQEAAEIMQYNPDLFGDFLHLNLYNLHLEDPKKRFSWAYCTVVQQLWKRKEVVLSPAEKRFLVGEVIERASVKFELPTSEIAFSETSMTGIFNWLRSLSPNVLEPQGKYEHFSRRYFCAASILVKAIDAIYRQQQRTYGVKIFLREEIKDAICQMLLLDPSGLDGSLDNAKRTYDYDQGGFFDWGYEGGYGEWLMLAKSPQHSELF